MRNLKIGYLSWGDSPAEFRRFKKFAEISGVNAEQYVSGFKYDVVIVTQNSDLTYWSRRPKNSEIIIFDFIDSYLKIEPYRFKRNLRGVAKFLNGEHKSLELYYHRLLELMMKRADAVVCSTPEQKKEYLAFNDNVHDILDMNDDRIRARKLDHSIGDRIHFVWEGMGGNVWAFREIASVLQEIYSKRPIGLHFVTDLYYKAYNGPLAWSYSVKKELKSILYDIPFYLYEWNPRMLSQICSQADIALLPIPKKPSIYWAKPENRLLMLWRMGLPVLASATPAYTRCMLDARVDGVCDNLSDWRFKLDHLIENHDARKMNAVRGVDYANQVASQEALCGKWMRVLESIL
jgi:hypothetical protein